MLTEHRLDYGSVTIGRCAAGEPSTLPVAVRAKCICGVELCGAGETFVEADHDLHQAFAKHQHEVDAKKDGSDT
jgi:hypothetical protein